MRTSLSLDQVVEKTGCEVLHTDHHHTPPSTFFGVAPLDTAGPLDLSFFTKEKYLEQALATKAGALFCTPALAELLQQHATLQTPVCLLACAEPYAAFAKVSQFFFHKKHPFAGVSPAAFIDPTATVHPTATVFPFVFLGPGSRVGAQTVIYSGCFLGENSEIGEQCILYPNVVVREGCRIGNRCLLNPGVAIGGDGFGFAPTATENVKIPQTGGVVIGDDVEIGANSTVDRGTLTNTRIGRQTKIDNLVMIAHNVSIGEFCFLAAQTGIAGSTTVGNRVTLAGQVGVTGHVSIGDQVTITAQSGVSKNIPSHQVWGGSPARPFQDHLAQLVALNRLAKNKNKKSGQN